MSNSFIINAHEYYPLSEGKLNRTHVEKAAEIFLANRHELKTSTMS